MLSSFHLLSLNKFAKSRRKKLWSLESQNAPGLGEPPPLWVIPPEKYLKGGEELTSIGITKPASEAWWKSRNF